MEWKWSIQQGKTHKELRERERERERGGGRRRVEQEEVILHIEYTPVWHDRNIFRVVHHLFSFFLQPILFLFSQFFCFLFHLLIILVSLLSVFLCFFLHCFRFLSASKSHNRNYYNNCIHSY